MENPSFMDTFYLVDLIGGCVQESASKPPLTNKLEDRLFDNVKIDKENIEANVYGEVLDKIPISTIQSFEALVTQSDEPKIQKYHRLGLKQAKPKKKKEVK